MKKCTKCLEVKELTEFSKMSRSKDGLQSSCKACYKKYQQCNSERIRDYQNQWRAENAEHIREYSKQYYLDNAEYFNQYRLENAEHIKQQSKEYSLKNAERVKKRNKQWREDNAEYVKQYKKEFRLQQKDGLHHVYYLPQHNYVGVTDNLYNRMKTHRNQQGRNTHNYQILASFEDRGKALRFESLMHDSGFEGRHAFNVYK